MTREICKACFEISRVGFTVPDECWKLSVPEQFSESVLCLRCFTAFADENGVVWDALIEFFPVSYITHFVQTGQGSFEVNTSSE